jgi:hypothetical protein
MRALHRTELRRTVQMHHMRESSSSTTTLITFILSLQGPRVSSCTLSVVPISFGIVDCVVSLVNVHMHKMHSLILAFIFGVVALADTTAQKTYDYVIVGGGTTGLVVTNRLSEDPKSMILPIILSLLQVANNYHLQRPS